MRVVSLHSAAPALPRSAPPSLAVASVPPSLAAASLGAFTLRKTAAGRTVSPPMLAFVFALALSNVGLMPAAHPCYDLATTAALPLSVSLGLLSAGSPPQEADNEQGGDLRPMAVAFAIGAVGTLLGALAAFGLAVRLNQLPRSAAACAAGLMGATYIGGSANFFGVAKATAAASHGALLPSLLAADLGLMGGYLLALTAAARSARLQRLFPEPGYDGGPAPGDASGAIGVAPPPSRGGREEEATDGASGAAEPGDAKARWRGRPALVAAASACAAGLACVLSAWVEGACGVPGSGTVLISVSSAAAGTLLWSRAPELASSMAPLQRSASLLLGCVFLASLGAPARLGQLIAAGPAAATFAAAVLATHCVVMMIGCRLANLLLGTAIPLRHMVIASNANVGGAGTAMAMAGALGWSRLAPAAATCGAIGYSCATLLGVGLAALLR